MALQYDNQTKVKSTDLPATGYPLPPPAAGAYQGYPSPAYVYPYESGNYSFLRHLIIAIISGVVLLGVISFFIWFILRPRGPVLNIENLSVSNFTFEESELNGNWDLNFDISNPNRKLDMHCDLIQVLIYYRRVIMTTSNLKSFLLERDSHMAVHDKLITRKRFVEEEMEEDLKKGSACVSVRWKISARFQNGGEDSREERMNVLCENLKLYYEGETEKGELGPGPWTCKTYLE